MRNIIIYFAAVLTSITLYSCRQNDILERQTNSTLINSSFEIQEIDLGDKAWGLNLLKVHVKNTSDTERLLVVHIGGRVPNASGFGMGDVYAIPPGKDTGIEHWYWIPPGHGSFDVRVSFKEVKSISPPWKEEPFLVKTFPFHFPMPNSRCNNLNITEKLPSFKERHPDVKHLKPFEYFTTEHFVFYCSPDTPAHKDIKNIMSSHELAMINICKFTSISPPEQRIAFFFYPDQETKKMCTGHTGNGLARGNMIAEVYNDNVKLDPNHELTHIVMGQAGNPPALFNEGFAVYMQAGCLWNNEPVDETAANLLKQGRLPALSVLIARTEIGSQDDDGKIAYPASASFVKFLIDTYGKEKFFMAYRELKRSDAPEDVDKNLSDLKAIYGYSLHELEMQWQQQTMEKGY